LGYNEYLNNYLLIQARIIQSTFLSIKRQASKKLTAIYKKDNKNVFNVYFV